MISKNKILHILILLILLIGTGLPAQLSAVTKIENTVYMSGNILPSGDDVYETSNTVYTDFVKFVRTPGQISDTIDINSTRYFPVALTNIGSYSDTYALTVSASGITANWFYDTGNIGVYDAGLDTATASFAGMSQGDTSYFLLKVSISTGINVGDTASVYDTITSQRYNGYMSVFKEQFTVTGDGYPPTIPNITYPSENSYINDSTPVFMWSTSTDTGVGVAGYVIMTAADSGFSQSLQEDTVYAPSVSHLFSAALPQGQNYVKVRAFDTNFNYSSFSSVSKFTVDTIKPAVPAFNTLADTYFNSLPIILSGICDSDVSSGTVSLAVTGLFTKASDTEFIVTISDLNQGMSQPIYLSVSDSSGNISDTAMLIIAFDSTAPIIQNLYLSHISSADTMLQISFDIYDSYTEVSKVMVEYFKNGTKQDSLSLTPDSGSKNGTFIISASHFDAVSAKISAQDRAWNERIIYDTISVSNIPPSVALAKIDGDSFVGQSIHSKHPLIKWLYNDYEGDTQKAVKIELSQSGAFSPADYTYTFLTADTYAQIPEILNPGTYFVRISSVDYYGDTGALSAGTETFKYDPLASIALTPDTAVVTADLSNVLLTATLTSYSGALIPSYGLSFDVQSASYTSVSSLVSDSAGRILYYYAGDTKAGYCFVTAADSELGIYDTTLITLKPGPAQIIYISSDTAELPADGASTATIECWVYDQYYNALSGRDASFSINLGKLSYDTVIIDSGYAKNAVMAGYTPGTASVNIFIDSAVKSYAIYFRPIPPYIYSIAPAQGTFVMSNDTVFFVRFSKWMDTAGITADKVHITDEFGGVNAVSIKIIDTVNIEVTANDTFDYSSRVRLIFGTLLSSGGEKLVGDTDFDFLVLADEKKKVSVSDTNRIIKVVVPENTFNFPYYVKISYRGDSERYVGGAAEEAKYPYIRAINSNYYNVDLEDSGLAQYTSFNKPLQITMKYDDADQNGVVDNTDFNEDFIKLFYFDEAENRWRVILSSEVDKNTNSISAMLDHLTVFGLFNFIQPKAIDKSFEPYPNPFYPLSSDALKNQVTLYHFLAKPGRVRIRILTVGGQLVKEFGWRNEQADMPRAQMLKWDGRNSDGVVVLGGVYYAVLDVEYSDGQKARAIQKILLMK